MSPYKNKEEAKANCREYHRNHKEEISKRKKVYYRKKADIIKKNHREYMCIYRKENPEKIKKTNKDQYAKNRDKRIENSKQYRKDNLEKCKKRETARYLTKHGDILRYKQQFYIGNKDKIKKYQSQYNKTSMAKKQRLNQKRRRRARLHNIIETFTPEQWEAKRKRNIIIEYSNNFGKSKIIDQWQQGKSVEQIADNLGFRPAVVVRRIRAYNPDYIIEGY